MANRRCLHALTRHASALFSTNPSLPSLPLPLPLPLSKTQPLKPFLAAHIFTTPEPTQHWSNTRHYSSKREDDDEDEDDDDDEDDGDEDDDDYDDDEVGGSIEEEGELKLVKREYSPEEKEAEAAEIGYKVVGPLEPSDRVFKRYDPVFAVVQVLLLLSFGVVFLIGCYGGIDFFFFLIFLCLDWIAPVQGEQWGFDLHWEIEILRSEWQGGLLLNLRDYL